MIERLLAHPPATTALVEAEGGQCLTYGELVGEVERACATLRALADRSLVLLGSTNTTDCVALYLACLDAGYPLVFVELRHPDAARRVCEAYAPELLFLPGDAAPPEGYREAPCPAPRYRLWLTARPHLEAASLHPDLALLLQTSGSTGSAKTVRLTLGNLRSNAEAIATYLQLTPDERAIQTLSLPYVYGLSVLNSHLHAGARLVLSDASFVRPELWAQLDHHGCTSFAGVPFMYETLHRLRFDPRRHPSLRTMTQAGGRLAPDLKEQFHARLERHGARFFVMYGLTEVAGRAAYVPPELLPDNLDAIGVPIPGGEMRLEEAFGLPEMRELVYAGPNVMLGYADSRPSLALGDECHGLLRTGDLARVNASGLYVLEGRLTRMAKLYGYRVHLDDVEADIERAFPVRAAAASPDDLLRVHVEPRGEVGVVEIQRYLARKLGVPPAIIRVEVVDAIPRTESGKIDYAVLC